MDCTIASLNENESMDIRVSVYIRDLNWWPDLYIDFDFILMDTTTEPDITYSRQQDRTLVGGATGLPGKGDGSSQGCFIGSLRGAQPNS